MKMRNERNPFTDYHISGILGRGFSSTVQAGTHIATGTPIAIKCIEKGDNVNSKLVEKETSIMERCCNPFIVQIYQKFETESFIYIVQEYVRGGSLLQYINENTLSEERIKEIFAQIVIGLDYLHHDVKVIHRDLKCENILIDENGNIRIIDFGLSTMEQSKSPMHTFCGTFAYCAPEVIEHKSYDERVDLWSLGVILYMMLFDRYPFFDACVSKMLNMIIFSELQISKDDEISFDPEAIRILKGLLQKDADSRISIEEIKQSSWFKSTVTAKEYSALDAAAKLINQNKCIEEEMDDELDEHHFENKEIVQRMLNRRAINDEMAKVLNGTNKSIYSKYNRFQTDFMTHLKVNQRRIIRYPSLVKPKVRRNLIIAPSLL